MEERETLKNKYGAFCSITESLHFTQSARFAVPGAYI